MTHPARTAWTKALTATLAAGRAPAYRNGHTTEGLAAAVIRVALEPLDPAARGRILRSLQGLEVDRWP